jgi:hypothetical protein
MNATETFKDANHCLTIDQNVSLDNLVNAVSERIIQCKAILSPVIADDDGKGGFLLSPRVIKEILWGVDDLLEQAENFNFEVGKRT